MSKLNPDEREQNAFKELCLTGQMYGIRVEDMMRPTTVVYRVLIALLHKVYELDPEAW